MHGKALLKILQKSAVSRLGNEIEYISRAGGSVFIRAHWRAGVEEYDHQSDSVVLSPHPRIMVQLSDLPSEPDPDEDLVRFERRNYTVAESRRDGQGMVELKLYEIKD